MSTHTIRLAAVQASSVFLDRAGSVEKAIRLIREAGERGVSVLGFPEGFIPEHPLWYHYYAASSARAYSFAKRLSENAIEVPGPEIRAIADAAREAGVFVVMGCCERIPRRPGTLYNTLVFIDEHGRIVGRHRKLVPTLGEQLVHTPADTLGLEVHPSAGGAMVSGLMCGENSNPLATFTLNAEGTNVHVASWPTHFDVFRDMRETIHMVSRSLAYQLKAFVINAIGTVSDEMLAELPVDDEQREWLAAQSGGATIVGPRGQVVAGPMEPGEGLLVAEVDVDDVIVPKFVHDFGGRHYNRFDLLRVELGSGEPEPFRRARVATRERPAELDRGYDLGELQPFGDLAIEPGAVD